MRTEQEVKEEMEATRKTIKEFREAFHNREISFETLKLKVHECHTMLVTLGWVLGQNDRFD